MNKFKLNKTYRKAFGYAKGKHNGMLRKASDIPYISHPVNVVSRLKSAGYGKFKGNENLFISALLHDVVEDTDTPIKEIEVLFGKDVADIVLELSEDEDGIREEYLASFMNASMEAKLIKLADRYDNLSDMINEYGYFSKEKIESYKEESKVLLRSCYGVNMNLWSKLCKLIYY